MFPRLNIDVGGWVLLQKLPLNFTESAISSLLELYAMHKEDFLLGSGLMQSDLYPCGGPEKQSIWPYVPKYRVEFW